MQCTKCSNNVDTSIGHLVVGGIRASVCSFECAEEYVSKHVTNTADQGINVLYPDGTTIAATKLNRVFIPEKRNRNA